MSELERILEPEVMDTEQDASEYDAMDHSGPNGAFVERLLELGAWGLMLDIGTGPGDIPLELIGHVAEGEIIGIDLSPEMLKIAEKKKADAPNSERVQFQVADAKELAFSDHHFDTVFSNTILHHIPDPLPFLKEAWRVLKPGGVLLIRDLFRPATQNELDALVQTYAGEDTPHQRQLFGDSLHAALTPVELRELAKAAGMVEVEIVVDTDRHMSLQTKRPG